MSCLIPKRIIRIFNGCHIIVKLNDFKVKYILVKDFIERKKNAKSL